MATLQEARERNLPRYLTGKACCHGHVAERMTSNRRCVVCLLAGASSWKKANREKVSATSKAWREANPEKVRNLKREWNAANPEGQKRRSRAWYTVNSARANQQHQDWAARNPGKVAALAAKHRSDLMRRTPAWANLVEIDALYDEAEEFREAGLDVHVDHVIPLRGHRVSGLHVPSNLRVCLASVNRSKSNSYSI